MLAALPTGNLKATSIQKYTDFNKFKGKMQSQNEIASYDRVSFRSFLSPSCMQDSAYFQVKYQRFHMQIINEDND